MPVATRMLAREWRGGELGVLAAALVLAVGVVVGISVFTGRLQGALEQESHRFLAADRVVASSRELPVSWWRRAGELGLARALTVSFPSMVYAGEEGMYLASIKAVTGTYPLRGQLRYRAEPFGPLLTARAGPARGEVWLDSRLFSLLDVRVGGVVSIGEAQFTVAAATGSEPDPPGGFFAYGPRVLMHYGDIPATGVVQPGSRVQYRQLYAGEAARLAAFSVWLEPQLQAGQRLLDVEQGQPVIARALRRAERFLLLAGSLAVALAGVAIALAAQRFSARHGDYVAIMKSLGATGAAIERLYGGGLLLLGLLATAGGCLLGWGLQALLLRLFAEQLPLPPGSAGVRPYLVGGATALACLLCFAWPPLRRLGRTSPLRVLRRELPLENRRTLADYLIGLAAVALLMFWYSGDWRLTLALLAGLALAVLLGLALALALLHLGRAAGMRAGSVWRLALAGLQRRGAASALQMVVFALAILLMLVLLLVRTSLVDAWQTQLPADAPNHFMVNIAPEEVQAIDQMLREENVSSEALYPMIRGRVMAVNGEALPAAGSGSAGLRQRESNFTWSRILPEGNSLVAGSWWPSDSTAALVSVERGFAESMGIALGDRVDFLVGSQPLSATVASLRELEWQSMRPNFFLIFPPQLLAAYPATFMTSFHLEPGEKPFLNRLIRRFPTVTVIEMDVVVGQIQSIVATVSAAVELVLAVILAAGALVLVAGVRASVDARMLESAILRALGARRGLILGGLLIEFATLGLFAGLLATFAAECSVWLLQERVMEMAYTPSPWVWPIGVLSGVLIIGGLGVWSCRRVVATPPAVLLREL